jgi:hypothetical protein
MKDNQLSEPLSDSGAQEEADYDLRDKIRMLEETNKEDRRLAEHRIILAELKVEAIRAGIVDLDGLKFLDTTEVRLEEDGGFIGAPDLISQLKRSKPWLFPGPSSSSVARVPPSRPARQKLAKDMTDAEYRVARANIIKRSES